MHMEFINTVYLLIYRIIKSGDYDLVVMVMACEDPFLNYSPLCVLIAPSMSYSAGNPHRKSISQDSKHEEQSSQESQNGNHVTEEFPDGGTRAWIVVIGVRVVLSPTIH